MPLFVTATGIDHASSGWGYCYRNILASGDAWIGYTMGREGIGFDALVRFDKDRYDVGLGFPNPIPLEERKGLGYNILQNRPDRENLSASGRIENAGFDRTYVKNIEGIDHYIGEFFGRSGSVHLRAVCLDKAPHHPTSTYAPFAFDFFENFRRDVDTGLLIEVE